MGTRADFYVGHGPEAEWLGSVAWDGYQWAESPCMLRCARTEEEYRAAVAKILEGQDDATTPDLGWPWPWKTSVLTDFTYAFDAGELHVYYFGRNYPGEEGEKKRDDWRDMSAIARVTMGERSGLLIFQTVKGGGM
jgi:hypothetical protein